MKTCDGCSSNDIAFVVEAMAARQERQQRRFIIAIVSICIATVLAVAGYATYVQYVWSQFEIVDDSVSINSHEGTANYIGNDGDITNGNNTSAQNKAQEKRR